jgi:hypothetical protein
MPGSVNAQVCYLLAREVWASAVAVLLRSIQTGFLTRAELESELLP